MTRRASRAARREEILRAAFTRFSQSGYHGTTIDDIAEEAGLSKGAVYWHFEGKRELFLALIDELLGQVERELGPPESGATARARLEHICEVVLRVDPGAAGMAELQAEFLAHAARDDELRHRLAGMGLGTLGHAVRAIEHGVKTGEFRAVDPERTALQLVAALDGLQVHQLVRPELDVNALWREHVDLLIRGMEAK